MLLSLLKILFFFAVVLVVSLGAVQLSETGQMLRIEYAGTEYALTPVKAVVALLVLMVLAWLVFKALGLVLAFIRFIAGDETAIDRYFARSRERKGYEALGEGMLAVASGEGKLAQDKAAKAEKYLNMPHITNLLSAQAAEVAGDKTRAGQVYAMRDICPHRAAPLSAGKLVEKPGEGEPSEFERVWSELMPGEAETAALEGDASGG